MDRVRKNEIIAVILFALSLFLFLSIFSFSERDLSLYTSSPNVTPQNLTGAAGACISGVLRFFAGGASYVIPLITLVWGTSRLFQVEARKVSFKLLGTAVLVVAVSASLSMSAVPGTTAAFARGGLVGTVVADFLLEYLGRVGATVFIIAMITLSMLVATEFLILPVLMGVLKFTSKTSSRLRSWLSERSDGMAPEITRGRNSRKAAREAIAKKLETMKKQVEEVRKTSLARRADERSEPAPKPAAEPRIVVPEEHQKAPEGPVRVTPVPDGATGKKVEYTLPGLDLLKTAQKGKANEREDILKTKAIVLEKTLLEFGVEARVVKINRGPVITMYELAPAMGTKVNRITSLSDNISLAMKAANIRIVAPLPRKGTIGIEVPNEKSEPVLLRDVLESPEYRRKDSPLKLALGKDISGVPIVADLARMPHLLIAGATGSGKTVCINCIVSNLLFNSSPGELKFLMIDPKRVELMMFEGIPHLVSPIVTNPKKAAAALKWVVDEMERRYEVFAENGTRDIAAYKEKLSGEELPYIVVVVDELADLMMVGQQDVEDAIMRIAQLSRAAGIHMVLATQRPSVNVITGVIKANFPARISFKVASKVDSRTVLDANGAEKLLGRGDMLFMQPGESSLIRGQCGLVDDSEIRNIVKFTRSQAVARYIEEAVTKQEKRSAAADEEKDELYEQALRIVIETGQASVSILQRKLRVGYTRAARMIDVMENEGIVGPYNGSKPREILVDEIETTEEWKNDET